MSNKEIALGFLKLAEVEDYRKAYELYVAPHFIHHNQYFKGDRESLLLAMEESAKVSPNKTIEVKHILEDKDKVMTYSKVTRKDPNAQKIAVVHIFRIENKKIVELWDMGQMIDPNSPNENGMF